MKNKVCILTTVHNYNDNRVYYKEVLSLASFGYNVTYVAPNINGPVSPDVHAVEIKKSKNTFKRIMGFVYAFNVARKQQCQVVHFQDAELIPTGLLLKMFTKTKVIYDVHEDYVAQMLTKFYIRPVFRKFLSKCMKVMEKLAGKYFDAIIVADSSVFTHFPKEKTTILYNYPSVRLLEEADNQIGEVKKEYDIIFPGSMAKFTAQLFLDVMKLAKERGRDIKGILISPFHFDGGKEWVIETAKEYGVYDNLTLMDRIPPYDVPKYLKATRIGLIPLPDTPKMRANIPTKMFEYMYCKLPVLTSDLPPCGFYMKQHNFGYLIKADDYVKYTDIILDLLDNEKKITQLGEEGKRLVRTVYNWETEELKLKHIYGKLLNV